MKTLITIGGKNMSNYYICNSKPVDNTCELYMGHYDLNQII